MSNYRVQVNKKWVFGSLYALLMLLVFVRYVFQIDFPPFILLAITILMACLGDRNEILAVCMLCIPLTTAFQYTYALLFALLLYLAKYSDSIRMDATVIPILLLVLWELFHCLVGDFSIKQLVVMFLPYLLCGILMWQDAENVDYAYVARAFAGCVCVMCITLVAMVLVRTDFNLAAAYVRMQRLGSASENSGEISLVLNPNSLGTMCALAVSCLLQLISTGKKKTLDVVIVIVLLMCGALSLSRTYLALILIMAALFWLAQEGSMGKKLRFLVVLVLIGMLAFGMLYLLFPAAIEEYITRFQVGDLTTGRSVLFRMYHQFLLSSYDILFFGIGLTNFTERIMGMSDAYNVPHNGFQEAAVAWGVIGLALFLAFVIVMVLQAEKSCRRRTLLSYIPLLLLLAKIQAGQMLTSDYTMLLFALCYLSLCQEFTPRRSARIGRRR